MKRIFYKAVFFLAVYIFVFADSSFAFSNSAIEQSSIIVTVINGRIRDKPNLQGEILKETKVGTLLEYIDEESKWYKIKLSSENESENGETEPIKTGWIAKSISSKFNSAKPDLIYLQIANKYSRRKNISLQNTTSLMRFLESAADDAKTFQAGGNLRLMRYQFLKKALRQITPDKNELPAYKAFLQKHDDKIIYSEPAGEWYVKSNELWELHDRYKKHKVGEKIAWEASKTSIPGECEGYVVCHVNLLRVTSGEYLNFYPNGKYSKQVLKDIINLLQPIVTDIPQKTSYYAPTDISDRAEFNKILTELRAIISKTPLLTKSKALKQIQLIGEGYR